MLIIPCSTDEHHHPYYPSLSLETLLSWLPGVRQFTVDELGSWKLLHGMVLNLSFDISPWGQDHSDHSTPLVSAKQISIPNGESLLNVLSLHGTSASKDHIPIVILINTTKIILCAKCKNFAESEEWQNELC